MKHIVTSCEKTIFCFRCWQPTVVCPLFDIQLKAKIDFVNLKVIQVWLLTFMQTCLLVSRPLSGTILPLVFVKYLSHTHKHIHTRSLCLACMFLKLARAKSWPSKCWCSQSGVLDTDVALVRTASDLPNLPGMDYRLGSNPCSGFFLRMCLWVL